jgi:ProP effector
MKSMNTSLTTATGHRTSHRCVRSSACRASPRSLLKQLQTQFPAFRDFLPLSIGIDKQLLAVLPDLDRKTMRTAWASTPVRCAT